MRNDLLFCRSPDPHLHTATDKVHLDVAVVCVSRADVESVLTGVGGV